MKPRAEMNFRYLYLTSYMLAIELNIYDVTMFYRQQLAILVLALKHWTVGNSFAL
jgi:hypothetical protein